MSLMERLFEILEEIIKSRRIIKINSVTVSIGEMRQVMPESFQLAFDAFQKGTAAEYADLIMEFVPVKIRCDECREKSFIQDNIYLCPLCGAVNTEVIEGNEILIKSIDGEQDPTFREKNTNKNNPETKSGETNDY
jgi:hydrogenase nickel incorporation protein HypA/HybF